MSGDELPKPGGKLLKFMYFTLGIKKVKSDGNKKNLNGDPNKGSRWMMKLII